ncbi:MAG: flavin reductase family protein [Acidimicrobiales bacterium]
MLGHFPTGVTVVTAAGEGGPTGVAIGSFASISLDPPLVGFFLGNQSSSGTVIEAAATSVSTSSPPINSNCAARWRRNRQTSSPMSSGPRRRPPAPLCSANIVGHIDCDLERIVELGDHNLIVGRVRALEVGEHKQPMVFFTGQYGTFG